MAKSRFVWILPVILGLTTLFLWFWSLAEFHALTRSMRADGFIPLESDYTPIPLIVAGGLNAPVATFASPMYALLHSNASNVKRVLLFDGVILQWSYVGWVWDRRKACRTIVARSRVIAVLGVLFGVLIVCVSFPMYHVGIVYKTAAVLWALFICLHFGGYWKNPVQHDRDRT
jgi:hypothetical protein